MTASHCDAGQFGTRLQGGKDAASARYIFTRLEPITRTIFHESDDKLLDYLNEEGQNIEPQWCATLLCSASIVSSVHADASVNAHHSVPHLQCTAADFLYHVAPQPTFT